MIMKKLISIALSLAVLFCSPAFTADRSTAQFFTNIEFTNTVPDNVDLVLGIYSDGELGRYGRHLDSTSDGALSQAIEATQFDAKTSSTKVISGSNAYGFNQILLVGLGSKEDAKTDLQWQEIGGNAVQAAIENLRGDPVMAFDVSASAAAQIAFGTKLGCYYFDKYYTDKTRKKSTPSVTVVTTQAELSQSRYQKELDPVADAMWLARDISNEPANVIYPESFVQQWKHHFEAMDNITIRVFDERDILKMGMGAFYGVGYGSKHPPRMMVVEYRGGKAGAAPVVIVGKGITFDSGGISIKPWQDMWDMKFDMSGAASAMGTLYALAGRGAEVNVVAIAALAENMPGGGAQRPGDIVTSMSGKTIEILQTDAEGRLVLSDSLYYGDVTYNPALLIDIATLTSAVERALGKDYGGLFTRHDELVEGFISMGKQTGDKIWHLPLNDDHFKAIESKVADVSNLALEGAGASTAAAFLGTFVRDSTHWVHLDIAGVAYNNKPTPVKSSPGSTSFAIRLLEGYIKAHFEGK